MRRGMEPRVSRDESTPGWTKHQLVLAAGFSPKTFDTVRKAARIKGPSHGGLGYVFGAEDLMALIDRAESGRFSRIGAPAAQAWRVLLVEAGIQMPPKISTRRRG